MKNVFALAWWLVASLVGGAAAGEAGSDLLPVVPRYPVPQGDGLVLDGRLDEPAWQTSRAYTAFGLDSGLGNLDLPTSVRFLRQGRMLWIGLDCGVPEGRGGGPVADALRRETFELWLDNTGRKQDFHYLTLSSGADGLKLKSPGFSAEQLAEAFAAQVVVGPGGHAFELRLELDRFDRLGPPNPERIGINLARVTRNRWASLAGIIGNAHKPDEFIELDLTGRADGRMLPDPYRQAFRDGSDLPALAEALAADWTGSSVRIGKATPGWALVEVTTARLRQLLRAHRADAWGLTSQLEVALYRALQARRDLARDVPATSSSEALRAVEAAVRSWPDGTGPYPATAWREQAYVSEVDGTAQPYALYVPPDYDPARTYPLVVDLHGSFNTHWGEGAVFSRYGREDPRFMRVAICARACMLYEPLALKDLWDVVAEVKARYNIDADKLCFVGYSAGAYAIHHLAIAYPDRIGAAVAVAGAGNGANAATLAGLPLLLRNGFDDSVVPWTGAAGRMALVQDAGTGVQVEILPATGHAVPVSGAIETLLARYAATRREADLAAAPGPGLPSFPALVQTEADRPGPLWNRGVGLIALRDPAERAGVAIRTAGEGSFAIRTANLELVALDFGQRDPGGLRGLTVDGQEVAVPSPAIGRYAVLRLAGSTWTLAFQAEPPAPDPVAYRSGGIFTVYDGTPLLIVAPASRAEVATILAGRLAYGRSAFVKIPSVLDTAVTDEEMQYCNLIVVGGPGENELVKRLAAAKGWPLPFLTAPFAATPPSAPPAPAPVPWRCRSRSPLLDQPSAVVLGGERFELARFGVSLVTRNPLAPTRRLWLIASEDARGYQPGSALLNMASWRAPAPDLRLVEISRNLRYDDWQLTRTWTVSENPMDRTLRD